MIHSLPLYLACYVLGSIPFGLLIARSRGVDIRAVGSGNIGATNVFRCVGKSWGLLAFALDFIKGLSGSLLLPLLLEQTGMVDEVALGTRLIAGVFAIVGHNWPVFLKFKGGKGVATTAGVLLGVAPAAVGVGLLAWVVLILTTRYVSVASMGAGLAVPAASWFTDYFRAEEPELLRPAVFSLLGLLVVWRHRSNIARLIKGEEHRFGQKKKGAGE